MGRRRVDDEAPGFARGQHQHFRRRSGLRGRSDDRAGSAAHPVESRPDHERTGSDFAGRDTEHQGEYLGRGRRAGDLHAAVAGYGVQCDLFGRRCQRHRIAASHSGLSQQPEGRRSGRLRLSGQRKVRNQYPARGQRYDYRASVRQLCRHRGKGEARAYL